LNEIRMTEKTMGQIAIERLRIFTASESSATPDKRVIFLAQLAKLGYRVTNPDSYRDSLLDDYDNIMGWRSRNPYT